MAVTANIHEAKTTLSKLIERALAGEEVVIAKAGKPLVTLRPVEAIEQAPAVSLEGAPKRSRGILGAMRGEFWFADDWDSPETNAEIERLFYEGDPDVMYGGVAEE
jgi:prevent-host-death family protein